VRQFALLMAVAALILVSFSGSALARHPWEWAPDIECGPEQDGQRVKVPGAVDPKHIEEWECKQDPQDPTRYKWFPVAPSAPNDGIGYKRKFWTASDDVVHITETRIEWINNVLYSGTDVFLRKPLGTPYLLPANKIGIKTRVDSWDGTSWTMCRESPWVGTSSTANATAMVKTWDWGTAPCGARWYVSHSWAEHYNGSAWEADPLSVVSQGGTTLGGVNASNGMVWDAPPGYKGKRAKPPKRGPSSFERGKPRPGRPQPTGEAAAAEPGPVPSMFYFLRWQLSQ
jgi:hypothetical protein